MTAALVEKTLSSMRSPLSTSRLAHQTLVVVTYALIAAGIVILFLLLLPYWQGT